MPEMQKPSVCRDVHYVAYGSADGKYMPGAHRAAKITAVGENIDTVSIVVFNPTGLFFDQLVEHDETCRPGTWHWPERV